jgi:hypothetical protein
VTLDDIERADLDDHRSELDGLDYLVWLATLDGNKLSPSYTPGLWGIQFAGGPTAKYDTSILYGTWCPPLEIPLPG